MFGIADLIGVVVVEERLDHLRRNPRHLNFILSPFCRSEAIRSKVGAKYIDQAVQYVTENRLHIAPYYQADLEKIPSLVFVSRTGENQQYIGDYGHEQVGAITAAPIVYVEFDAKAVDRYALIVPKGLRIEEKIWKNVILKQGDFLAGVCAIHVKEGEDTRILLDKDVPPGLPLAGWKAQSSEKITNYTINSSTDDTELVAKLTTTGDYSVHRLMATVVRYCLKSARLLFESYGFQTPRIQQGMPTLADDTQMVYETIFTITGKVTDHWIAHEYQANDPSDSLDVGVTACNGESSVVLE